MGIFKKIKRGLRKSAKRNVVLGRVTLAGTKPTVGQRRKLAKQAKKYSKRTKSVIKKILY